MPRKDVWIKKVDVKKWEALKNKSEFVHNALNAAGLVDEVFPTKGQMITRSEFVPVKPAKIEKHPTFFKDKKLNK